jgi:hypothetical protein
MLADHPPTHGGPMIATAGDTALIVLAGFWGLLVLFLCFVLLSTIRVLESTKMTVDTMREETVPLLREIKTSIEKTNGHLDRVGTVLDSAGSIVGRVEKVSGLVEEVVASPLIKIIGVGAGLRKAASRFGGQKKDKREKASGA